MSREIQLPRLPAGFDARLPDSARRRAFSGRADQVAVSRRFVAQVLAGHPAAEAAILIASEMAANAVTHSKSREDGVFEVAVWRGRSAACVAVADDGADGVPVRQDSDPMCESGRGLAIAEALAICWGHFEDGGRGVTWFVVSRPDGQASSG